MALELIGEYDNIKSEEVKTLEDKIDRYEDILCSYLVKISRRELSIDDSRSLSVILPCISDMERISDHAVHLCGLLGKLCDQDQSFSDKAKKELLVLAEGIRDIVGETAKLFTMNDMSAAKSIEPLDEALDGLNMSLRQRHIERLRDGKCTIELGLILEDILANLEQISYLCSNIAVCMIQVKNGTFDMKEYVDSSEKQAKWYYDEVKRYTALYSLSDNHDAGADAATGKRVKKQK